jgi:glucose-6-phosphate 1-dehydrogenase
MAKLTSHLSTSDADSNRLFYLSLPPSTYKDVIAMLPSLFAGNDNWNRVVIEKPIGTDTSSFADIREYINTHLPGESVYLMDHYLAKPAVDAIRTRTVGHSPSTHVDVLFSETLGVDGRPYFDQSGIVRDIVQNHILQVVATLINPADKLAALRRLTPMTPDNTVLGQYTPYPFPNSATPTYIDTTIYYDHIPVRIRAGKRLRTKIVRVTVDHATTIDIESTSRAGAGADGAYETAIADVFTGDRTRFVTFDEVAESWRIVQDVLDCSSGSLLPYTIDPPPPHV